MRTHRKGFALALNQVVLILFLIVAAIPVFGVTDLFTDPHAASSLYLARDMSLLVSTLPATPFDVAYTYPTSLEGKNLVVEEDIIYVDRDAFEIEQTFAREQATYYPSDTISITLPEEPLDASLFALIKEGTTVSFNAKLEKTTTPLFPQETIFYFHISGFSPSETEQLFNLLQTVATEQHLETSNDLSASTVQITLHTGEKAQIHYSSAQLELTKALASRLASLLYLNNTTYSVALLEDSVSVPTISITLPEQNTKELASLSGKRSFSRQLITALRLQTEQQHE